MPRADSEEAFPSLHRLHATIAERGMYRILPHRLTIVPTTFAFSERGLCRRNHQRDVSCTTGNQVDLRNDEECGQVLLIGLKELVGVGTGSKLHRRLQR